MPLLPDAPTREDLAVLLDGFISITAASRSPEGRPSLGRGVGGRMDPVTGRMVLLFPAGTCAALLADLAVTGAIAVVLSVPDSHRTLQVKGRDAAVGPADPRDLPRVAAYRDTFARGLDPMGFPEALVRTLLACGDADLRAVAFTPSEVYDQTPGPQAGMRLGGAR